MLRSVASGNPSLIAWRMSGSLSKKTIVALRSAIAAAMPLLSSP